MLRDYIYMLETQRGSQGSPALRAVVFNTQPTSRKMTGEKNKIRQPPFWLRANNAGVEGDHGDGEGTGLAD